MKKLSKDVLLAWCYYFYAQTKGHPGSQPPGDAYEAYKQILSLVWESEVQNSRGKGEDLKIVEPFLCPSCGREWDTKKHNACQCGAVVGKPQEPSEAELGELIKESGRAIWLMNFVKGGEELARQMFKAYDKLRRENERYGKT